MGSTLFEGQRINMVESIRFTIASLCHYAERHRHWAVAWSGGKDSTTLLTLVVYLIESGKVPRPESLVVLYADTRAELLPLAAAANEIMDELRERGIECRRVMAPMDKRFLVYILGRGVPPPNNNTLRWCTRQIKVDPMQAELARMYGDKGDKLLVLTGVRQGESAMRDGRIAMSCGRDGAECGQGWYQEACNTERSATLAPILHWRVCHVWQWLRHWAPLVEYGEWPTEIIADAYGGDEAEEINARTGCVGCPLASQDTALDAVIRKSGWSYLAPLKDLRILYRELRMPHNRLRKPGGEKRADGTLVENQHRMGPLTLEARSRGLRIVLDIQERVNREALRLGRPRVDLLNAEEVARIRALIDARTWPQRWTGAEPKADEPFVEEGDTPWLWADSCDSAEEDPCHA